MRHGHGTRRHHDDHHLHHTMRPHPGGGDSYVEAPRGDPKAESSRRHVDQRSLKSV